MAPKFPLKYIVFCYFLLNVYSDFVVESRPEDSKSFTSKSPDESDRTLIRVLRSDFEDEEKAEEMSMKRSKKRAEVHNMPPLKKKRATEEDQFFQALLSRADDNKPIEKRSYESQPEKDDVRPSWPGDSKITDADRSELENLFSAIGSDVEEKEELKAKKDVKRATKTGVDGKVQDLVEWLMAQPPKEFHDSLRHIIDVERELSDMFAVSPDLAKSSITNTNTTESAYGDYTTDPYTTTTTSDTSPPTTTTTTTTNYGTDPSTTTIASPSATTLASPQAYTPPAAAAASMPAQDSKKGYSYADMTEAAKTMSQPGPGAVPKDAMDYFNKFTGGVANLQPNLLTNYGVHPQELNTAPAVTSQQQSAVASAPAITSPQQSAVASQQHYDAAGVAQQAPAMSAQQQSAVSSPQQQQSAVQPQQVSAATQVYGDHQQQQQQQQGYGQQAAYAAQYLYGGRGGGGGAQNTRQGQQLQQQQQQVSSYRRPYQMRGSGYKMPAARPYPMNQDELDEPTDKNTAKVTLLFKQNWSSDFASKKSTKYRVFKDELKKELKLIFEAKKHFKTVVINRINEDRGKVSVAFSVKFDKKTKRPLKELYEQITRDKLGNMPVYRDTLIREGKTHERNIRHRGRTIQKEETENPATEFAKFADQMDREMTGENIPLSEKHEAYQGCFKDKKPHRDMKKHFSKFEMTPEWCVHTCKREGYRFAGVQYSYLCFCGNKYGKYGRVPDSECDSRCYGDKNRFCGAFWHNSIYSVDGQHHDLSEFSAVPDDDEDEEGPGDKTETREDDKKQNDKQHAEVANHLMKAASSALKAAKKLLPGRNKRQTEKELMENKRQAEASLKAVDEIVERAKKVEKRSNEDTADGKNLLMAYLGNVGGYDREYRSVEDENTPVEKLKFDYKRMVVDEEGDGEFISKKNAIKDSRLKRSRRSMEDEDESEDFDGRKKMASRAVEETTAMNPKQAIAEPSRRELMKQDSSDEEITRRSRDIDEEEEVMADMTTHQKEEQQKTINNVEKRSASIDQSLYHGKVEEGLEANIGEVIDVMKGTADISLFKDHIQTLTADVTNGLAIPEEQKTSVNYDIHNDIKETALSRMNMLMAAIRTEISEYGEMHPAIGPQADEASKTVVDLPLDQSTADNIKNKIRKRSAEETENDSEEKEKLFLSEMLKAHSRR